MRCKPIILLLLIFISLQSIAQDFIPLWPEGKKPNFNGKKITDSLYNERIWRVSTPGIYSFIVPKSENKGTAVLICPGGGYERLSHLYNGFNLAKWYNTIGVNAFVLIYRLPHQQDLIDRKIAPLQDAQRAMRIIRKNAAQWLINTEKIGVMGTSAGGHVATTLYTHTNDVSLIHDALDTISYSPDFMVLLSPVISMGKYAHPGSKKNLLGTDTTETNIRDYSNELQVKRGLSPVFMVHAENDSTVNVLNSLLFYTSLLQNNINASIHIFPQGGHTISLADSPGSTDLWPELLERWLREMKCIDPLPRVIKK